MEETKLCVFWSFVFYEIINSLLVHLMKKFLNKNYLPTAVGTFDMCQTAITRYNRHTIITSEPFHRMQIPTWLYVYWTL